MSWVYEQENELENSDSELCRDFGDPGHSGFSKVLYGIMDKNTSLWVREIGFKFLLQLLIDVTLSKQFKLSEPTFHHLASAQFVQRLFIECQALEKQWTKQGPCFDGAYILTNKSKLHFKQKQCESVPGVAILDYMVIEQEAWEGLGREASKHRQGPAEGQSLACFRQKEGRCFWAQSVSAVSVTNRGNHWWCGLGQAAWVVFKWQRKTPSFKLGSDMTRFVF